MGPNGEACGCHCGSGGACRCSAADPCGGARTHFMFSFLVSCCPECYAPSEEDTSPPVVLFCNLFGRCLWCFRLLINVIVQLLEIDRRRQGLREGTRSLKRQAAAAACALPVWVELPGGAAVQLPYREAETWLLEVEMLLPCSPSSTP